MAFKGVLAILVSLTAVLIPRIGSAAELLLYDGEMTYEDSENAFYWFGVPGPSPADWTAPDDYANGEWHARYEIIDQPPYATYGQPTGLQSCVWQDGKGGDYPETCGSVHFLDGPGAVATTVETPASWWEKADSQASAAPFEWDRGGDFVDMGSPTWHRNEDGGRCLATIASWGGCEENMDVHLPMTIQITIVIVSAGSAFSGWENYGFGDGEPDQDGGQDSDGGLEPDADGGAQPDADDDVLPDADGGAQPDADGGPDADGTDGDGSAEGDGETDAGGDPGADGAAAVDGGCKCGAPGRTPGLFLMGLAIFWLCGRRRRGSPE